MLKSEYNSKILEAGCDEAGRGCLSGPVYAAAVILPKNYQNKILNDSKQINEKTRYQLREQIEKDALAYAVGVVDNIEIDKINILNASFLAMHRAIDKLNIKPEFLLIDGNRFNPYKDIKHACIIKGDAIYMSIAAASILAKTYRDDYMLSLHKQYPQYAWNKNQGYPTAEHRRAIAELGISPFHRKTFRLLPAEQQLSLF